MKTDKIYMRCIKLKEPVRIIIDKKQQSDNTTPYMQLWADEIRIENKKILFVTIEKGEITIECIDTIIYVFNDSNENIESNTLEYR